MPDDVALRLHFRANIWPNIKNSSTQAMPNSEEGDGYVM
jgi:hypothetical protein